MDVALSNNDTTSIVSLVQVFEDAQQKYNEFKSQLIQSNHTLRKQNSHYRTLESQLIAAKTALTQWLQTSPTNGSKTLWELAQAYEDIGKEYGELSTSLEEQQISKKISLAILDIANLLPDDASDLSVYSNGSYRYKSQGKRHLHRPDDTKIDLPEDASYLNVCPNGSYTYTSQGKRHLHRPDDTKIDLPDDASNFYVSDTHISFESAINGTKRYYNLTYSQYKELFGPEKEKISTEGIKETWSKKVAYILQRTWFKDTEIPKS